MVNGVLIRRGTINRNVKCCSDAIAGKQGLAFTNRFP
jgi:hypothetical protein